jgi:hypothetical protein
MLVIYWEHGLPGLLCLSGLLRMPGLSGSLCLLCDEHA